MCGRSDNTAKQPAARQVRMQNTCKQSQSIAKGEPDFHLELNLTHKLCPHWFQSHLRSAWQVLGVMSTDTQMPTWSEQEQLPLSVTGMTRLAGSFHSSLSYRVEHREASSTLLSWLPSLNTSSYNPFLEKQPCACREKLGSPNWATLNNWSQY